MHHFPPALDVGKLVHWNKRTPLTPLKEMFPPLSLSSLLCVTTGALQPDDCDKGSLVVYRTVVCTLGKKTSQKQTEKGEKGNALV